jgi:NADH:ubiquinone oxidoreductase subunit D
MQLGYSDPMLRGSGVEWDLRRSNLEVYDRIGLMFGGRQR